MEMMNAERESVFILLLKIGNFLSDPPSIASIHSFVLTLSQYLEIPLARKIYGKLSLFGRLEREGFEQETIHYFAFPSNCNIYTGEIMTRIQEIAHSLPPVNFVSGKRDLGSLLKTYCMAYWSNSDFHDPQFRITTRQLIQLFDQVHKQFKQCTTVFPSNILGDVIDLGLVLLKGLLKTPVQESFLTNDG